MPLNPALSVAATINPSTLLVTDLSTGGDPAITDRIITIYDSSNALIGTFDFPLSVGASISIAALTQDIAINLVINWMNSTPVSIYNASGLFVAVGYNQAFLYNLTQAQTGNPNIIRDNRYYGNKIALMVEVNSAQQAITQASDIAGAEFAITRANYISSNSNFFF